MKTWGINWIDSTMRTLSYFGLVAFCSALVIQLDNVQRNISVGVHQEPVPQSENVPEND